MGTTFASGHKGFTLVELLIVIGILGVLMTIMITSYGNSVQRANDQQVKANVDSIRTSLELFRRSTSDGYYPSTLRNLQSANFNVPNYPHTNSIDGYNYLPLPPGCEVVDMCTSYEITAVLESTDEVYIATPQSSEVTNDPAKSPTPIPTATRTPTPSRTPTPTPSKTPIPTATRTPTPTPYDCNTCPDWNQVSVACGAEVGCPTGQAQFRCNSYLTCMKCMTSNQCYVLPTVGPIIKTPTVPIGWGGETF